MHERKLLQYPWTLGALFALSLTLTILLFTSPAPIPTDQLETEAEADATLSMRDVEIFHFDNQGRLREHLRTDSWHYHMESHKSSMEHPTWILYYPETLAPA